MVVLGSACEAASCTSRSGTPASRAAVMNACRRVCGLIFLANPARRATRPVQALADGQIDRPGGARRERNGDDLAALPEHGQRAVTALNPKLVDIGAEG